MMALDEVFEYLRSYDKDAFAVFSCQGNEPTEADVAAFERDGAGFRLPEEFRQFTMSSLGGLYMEVREELWPRPKAYEVGPFWSFLYGLQVYGMGAGIPDWLDLRLTTQTFRNSGYRDLVPFMQIVGDADRWCFDQSGRIVIWSHDDPDATSDEGVAFADLLMREIHGLEDRLLRKRTLDS